MPDTRSPYDDEVVDPYAADDDVKNPHEEAGASEADADVPSDDDPAPRPRRGRPKKNP